jgi:hypothetical protein
VMQSNYPRENHVKQCNHIMPCSKETAPPQANQFSVTM